MIYELYGEIWNDNRTDFLAEVGKSLSPRSPDMLFTMWEQFDINTDTLILDVGCRGGIYSLDLARKFGCRVIALDPVPLNIEKTERLVSTTGLEERIEIRLGRIEDLPFSDASVDHVWCRDVLLHVDLPKGLAECFRVLRPGGYVMVYTSFSTPLLEPEEARRLFKALSIVPENMSEAYFERVVREADFEILDRDWIDSEWGEIKIEVGDKSLAEILLYASRMRRAQAELVGKYGENRYEAHYADCLWEIYPMLGKLRPIVYTLTKPL